MPSGKQSIGEATTSEDDDQEEYPILEVDGDEDEDEDQSIEDMPVDKDSPYSGSGARTVYHQRRSDQDTLNSTQSLYDSDITYFMIHGRRYCKDYYMPNDEEEQDRTQILHSVYLDLFHQLLTTVPLDKPTKILDIGTGLGEWAMAMGDEYPEAEVIGTDIAKIQPTAVPLNVFFEIDDAEEEGGWTWPEDEFDLIHFRTMAGAFKSWTGIYTESFKHLKPGGYIEVVDFDDHERFMSYFDPSEGIHEWLLAINEASRVIGRPRGAAHLSVEVLESLGFVDVKITDQQIPMGNWPDDPGAQQIGKHFLVAQLCGIEALCLRPLTETMSWDVEKVRAICDVVTQRVRSVALDPEQARGLGFNVRCLTGRKPGGAPLGDGVA
ncbi:putative Demethylmenaquinone methyltransferase [Amylocarpus encephaloides]|uniref:Demethylmenaquinone methyltransferase n=1 Tax=Amylocarpus encephaloides TaxID=45428 RepID=A0A9P7YUH3_9HELO|nr:putative Demethylmenaquinone methyltransferase [Amylocarpus encephaloides]